jgi:hypothetical protein
MALEELLVKSGSGPAALIVAVLVIVVPAVMLGLRWKTKVKMKVCCGLIPVTSVQVMVPVLPTAGAAQVQDPLCVSETNVVPGGNASVSTLGGVDC